MCEIRWKLTSVFNVDFEQILYFFGVDFEQVGNILCKMPINDLKNWLGTSRRTNHFEHWSSLGIPSGKLKIGKTANRFKMRCPLKNGYSLWQNMMYLLKYQDLKRLYDQTTLLGLNQLLGLLRDDVYSHPGFIFLQSRKQQHYIISVIFCK